MLNLKSLNPKAETDKNDIQSRMITFGREKKTTNRKTINTYSSLLLKLNVLLSKDLMFWKYLPLAVRQTQ